MDIDARQDCKLCGGSFTVRAVVEAISSWWAEVDVAIAESPCCRAREEVRIETGKVWRGYVYAAGARHFCGMEEYEVPDLVLEGKDADLRFTIGGQARSVPKE